MVSYKEFVCTFTQSVSGAEIRDAPRIMHFSHEMHSKYNNYAIAACVI